MTVQYYFTDNRNLLVRYVDSNGNLGTVLPSGGDANWVSFTGGVSSNPQVFGRPWGCFSDPTGRFLYVVDESAVLWQWDSVLNYVTGIIGGGSTLNPLVPTLATDWRMSDLYEVTCDSAGNVYVNDAENVIAVNMQSTTQNLYGVSIPAGFAAFILTASAPVPEYNYGMAIDSTGNMYVTDQGDNAGDGNKVYKITPSGVQTTIAGNGTAANAGDGGSASAATFDAPFQLSIDTNDILYVIANGESGGSNPVIRAINLSGTTQAVCGVTIAPGNIDTLYTFPNPPFDSNPWFSCPDNNGNLYVTDQGISPAKGAIHVLDSAGGYNIVAGTSVPGYTGDGGPALSGQIGEAYGLAFGTALAPTPGSGNIVVAKRTNPATSALKMFAFTPSWGSGFSLHDGQSTDSGPIVTGTYSIAETAVAGWSSSAVVSSGDPINALNLTDGQTITVTFTNSPSIPTISTLAKVYPWVS